MTPEAAALYEPKLTAWNTTFACRTVSALTHGVEVARRAKCWLRRANILAQVSRDGVTRLTMLVPAAMSDDQAIEAFKKALAQ